MGLKLKMESSFLPIFDFIRKCKNCGEQFAGLDFCPKCKGREFHSKGELIEAMRKLALEVNSIFIATDPDIEGEKIAYDVYCSLYPMNMRARSEHFQLYDLIFKRFIASQMRETKLLYQRFKVLINGNQTFIENPVGIISEGFNLVLPIKIANRVEEGEYPLKFARLLYLPAARPFTQGEIIALMKERGIGRPSTYAKTVATILERRYAIEKGNRLISTVLGFKVYKYLSLKFGKYASEEATRKLEAIMDQIEQGEANYKEILKELYQEIMEIRKI